MTLSLATALRFLSVDMVEKAASGHPGMPLGMADVLTVLMPLALRGPIGIGLFCPLGMGPRPFIAWRICWGIQRRRWIN